MVGQLALKPLLNIAQNPTHLLRMVTVRPFSVKNDACNKNNLWYSNLTMFVLRFVKSIWLRGFAALMVAGTPLVPAHAQVSKANQILINRGLQIEGLISTYDTFHLSTYSNANYTSVLWSWDPPRPYNSMSVIGPAPGFPWARWVTDETDMPPQGGESPYLSQLVKLQLADEWNLNDDATRTRAVNWFNSVRSNWPNTILSANNYGGQVTDGNLIDFVSRAQPDMIYFDTYPWKSVYDVNAPDHIGPPIAGTPITWYSQLRIYRDISRAFNIPFGSYVQTFHSVEEYYPYNVYRNPSPSELRLNHFGALAFNAKMLLDFVYNNGASSLFNAPGGDSNPNALYYEKADCALRARNFGKALVRLKPIDEATAQWTTSVMFIRGKDPNGTLNPIPINFYAGPGGADANTDWVADRNDPYLRGWTVTNTGTKNNAQPGDVLVAWFKLLDESFDGAGYTNELYFMVVNGLTATNGTAADCSQQVKLNFLDTFSTVELLDSATGVAHAQVLPIVSTRRQLTLDLNGGDAALFKIADSAPFVGVQKAGPPVIGTQPTSRTNLTGTTAIFNVSAFGPDPLTYQWRKNGANLTNGGNVSGAMSSALSLSTVIATNAGTYDVIVTGAGSVTSAPAVLAITTNSPGQLFLYEPFNYSNVGGSVSSNTPANWAYGGTGANDLNVAPANLSYPGLPLSVGNSVTNGGAGLGVRRLIGATVSGGAVYFSALFRINDLGFGTWNGASTQAGALTATNTSTFQLQVMVKSNSPSGYVIGVQKGGTGFTTVFDNTERHIGETLFLVGKYDYTVSPNSVSLWINPPSSSFGASEPAGSLSTTTGTNALPIDEFNMRQNTTVSVPAAMQWDELRVGTTWNQVTPLGPPPALTFLTGWARLANGAFRFDYTNASSSLSVYASTNLTNWLPIGAATLSAQGVFQFIDADATNYPRRFYQLRAP